MSPFLQNIVAFPQVFFTLAVIPSDQRESRNPLLRPKDAFILHSELLSSCPNLYFGRGADDRQWRKSHRIWGQSKGSWLHSVEQRPLRLRNTTAMLQPSKMQSSFVNGDRSIWRSHCPLIRPQAYFIFPLSKHTATRRKHKKTADTFCPQSLCILMLSRKTTLRNYTLLYVTIRFK